MQDITLNFLIPSIKVITKYQFFEHGWDPLHTQWPSLEFAMVIQEKCGDVLLINLLLELLIHRPLLQTDGYIFIWHLHILYVLTGLF